MFKKLIEIEKEYEDLTRLLATEDVIQDQTTYRKYAKKQAELRNVVERFREYKKVDLEIQNTIEMMNDSELKELAKEEIESLNRKKRELTQDLKLLLIPKDPDEDKSVILEIRAGTGGEESSLFVADLFRMYTKYADRMQWKVDVMSSNPTGLGGFKEIIAGFSGKGVYGRFKYESGIHRVQRVPITESSGRIHTSAVSVCVLPEVPDIEVKINPEDLKIDTFRAGGPGGQHVNVTDSAVRITHLPTGIVVSCQDERSQKQNKEKAMKILRARIYERMKREQEKEIQDTRKKMVGTGDRSEKIRTYNFPQNRVTDHRIDLTLYKLNAILEGDLDEFISSLAIHEKMEKLKEL
ncbi:MAG: peptide chain release factor 1 [bacterium]|nr:peptide chain release factor 1 [bacterium]